MKLSQHIIAFFMGYFLYCLFEIDTRGYTHWTMALTKGFLWNRMLDKLRLKDLSQGPGLQLPALPGIAV